MVIEKIKRGFSNILGKEEMATEDYVEVDVSATENKSKVIIKPFILRKFDDVSEILNHLREGYTIAVIDIQHLRKKDVIELKRAISKIKKTVEAMEGSITGFGESIVIATPQFAQIVPPTNPVEESQPKNKVESY
ncbi:MAG: cell division protein SepF [Candidatus Pacearchaeota archaeon]